MFTTRGCLWEVSDPYWIYVFDGTCSSGTQKGNLACCVLYNGMLVARVTDFWNGLRVVLSAWEQKAAAKFDLSVCV